MNKRNCFVFYKDSTFEIYLKNIFKVKLRVTLKYLDFFNTDNSLWLKVLCRPYEYCRIIFHDLTVLHQIVRA